MYKIEDLSPAGLQAFKDLQVGYKSDEEFIVWPTNGKRLVAYPTDVEGGIDYDKDILVKGYVVEVEYYGGIGSKDSDAITELDKLILAEYIEEEGMVGYIAENMIWSGDI